MSILSRLPFGKKPDPASAGRGPVTGCDLSHAEALVRPFAQDAFFRLRPPFSKEAAQLSLELADMTYTLELAPWKAAGWNDFSILIDDSLQSGLTHWETGDGLSSVINRIKVLRAKAALKEPSPVSQVLSALRQKEKSDTVKAVCMMHPLSEDKWLLAIGFMGTGKRFYDWFSNFRFTPEEGFHRGFNQLCESFQLHVEDIVFPAVAEAMGLEKLTLGQVLADMRSLSSPFRLWMAGHSQGGAVMQVFTHRLMNDWGVLPQNMVGYGLASPTVATGKFVYDPAAYPLYHLCNSDDLVPRVGARVHLGVGLSYPAGEDVRRAACGWEETSQASVNRALMRRLTRRIVDAPSCLESTLAYMELLLEHNDKWEEGLATLTDRFAFFKRALDAADRREADLIRFIKRHASRVYFSMTGRTMDPARIAEIKKEMEAVEAQIGLKAMSKTLQELMYWPHTLAGKDGRDGSYAWIVHHGLKDIQPFIWQGGRDPVRLWLRSGADNGLSSLLPSAVAVRRRTPAPRRPLPRRHHGYSARRNA